jgi:hypothetical protein
MLNAFLVSHMATICAEHGTVFYLITLTILAKGRNCEALTQRQNCRARRPELLSEMHVIREEH